MHTKRGADGIDRVYLTIHERNTMARAGKLATQALAVFKEHSGCHDTDHDDEIMLKDMEKSCSHFDYIGYMELPPPAYEEK